MLHSSVIVFNYLNGCIPKFLGMVGMVNNLTLNISLEEF